MYSNHTLFGLGLSTVSIMLATSAAQAQDARQWRVADGGNGHWYESVPVSIGSFEELIAVAEDRGAQPVSVTSQGEHDLVASFVTSTTPETWTYLGARISAGAGCGQNSWFWLDGSPWSYSNWDQSNPTNQPDCAGSDAIVIGRPNGSELQWHDGPITNTSINVFAIIEWSADCNGDGIVDYGQILDGTLTDADGNGVPDCCEEGQACSCNEDLNHDGTIDGADLSILIGYWGMDESNSGLPDLTGDGRVDGMDLAQILSSWGTCPE